MVMPMVHIIIVFDDKYPNNTTEKRIAADKHTDQQTIALEN